MPYKNPEDRRAYWRRRRREVEGRAPLGSPEHRARVSAGTREHWKTREPIDQDAEKNPNWKGGEAGWSAVHKWLRRNVPKAGRCEECGVEGKTDWAFRLHPATYTRVRADYAELCRRCHVGHDRLGKPW